jgi:hypothetical protein
MRAQAVVAEVAAAFTAAVAAFMAAEAVAFVPVAVVASMAAEVAVSEPAAVAASIPVEAFIPVAAASTREACALPAASMEAAAFIPAADRVAAFTPCTVHQAVDGLDLRAMLRPAATLPAATRRAEFMLRPPWLQATTPFRTA